MKNYFFLLLAGLTLGACGNKAAQQAATAATTASTAERTFAMIKPDAVKAGHTGAIISRVEAEGFKVVGLKKVQFSLDKAQRFYAVHKDRPFYADLTTFMSSSPTVVMVLEKDNAIKAWRELMGATNPANAEENTLRKLFAQSVTENAVHGSDAPETAAEEIAFFFAQDELV